MERLVAAGGLALFAAVAADAIVEGAKSGQIGDGKIFILDLPDCIRIRTGERGSDGIG